MSFSSGDIRGWIIRSCETSVTCAYRQPGFYPITNMGADNAVVEKDGR